jgi:hypothetical protein
MLNLKMVEHAADGVVDEVVDHLGLVVEVDHHDGHPGVLVASISAWRDEAGQAPAASDKSGD